MGAIDKVKIHIRRGESLRGSHESLTLVIQMNHIETSDPTTPTGNRNFRKAEVDAVYEIKVAKSIGRGWMQCLRHVGLQGLGKSGVISGKERR